MSKTPSRATCWRCATCAWSRATTTAPTLAANWGYLYQEFGEKERVTIYELDQNTNTAAALYAYDFEGKYLIPGTITNCPECDRQPALGGVRVPARPHLGTAGVAPAVDGRVSTIPPGAHGGNIDNWRIGAGATMYYPVQVEGGLSRSVIPTSARATVNCRARPSRAR